jgi:two-component system, cell cycle sensor histidine kinase PleC
MTLARQRPQESLDEAAMPSVLEALHCLRIAITVFDADERLIFVNQHFGYLFRSLPPREDLIGRRYDDLLRLEIESGEIAHPDVLRDIEGFVAGQRAQLFATDFGPRDVPLADGRIVEIKMRRTPSRGWIALWTDVTQARRDFDRLRNVIGLSADAFAFYDRRDKLTLCNAEYALLTGANTPEELIGCTFTRVAEQFSKNISGQADAWLKRRLEVHREPAGAMTLELASGTAYLLRDRVTSDGGRVIVFTDITERHRAEKALAEQTRALKDARKALAKSKAETMRQASYLADLSLKLDQTVAQTDTTKKTLLRTMSHELKTPLNAIIGFSDLLGSLADQAGPDQVREYAGLIHQGGNNLLRLINQILDLTKISAGRYELRRQSLDAGLGLWLARENNAERAAAKNIVIVAETDAPGLMIDADENAYGAMVGHLVENAVHFTQDGGEVRLSIARRNGFVRITVADNGPGVPPEDLERILEPFEQGGRTTTDHAAGAGLGLTLVKAFSELHGGTLTVHSAPGEGFTAAIELPAAG